jgi:hypothetical protein
MFAELEFPLDAPQVSAMFAQHHQRQRAGVAKELSLCSHHFAPPEAAPSRAELTRKEKRLSLKLLLK